MPHKLNEEQKEKRVEVCLDLLDQTVNDEKFLEKIVTGDESWVYPYDPETAVESAEWLGPHEKRPHAVKLERFQKGKLMIIVFFITTIAQLRQSLQ